MEEDIETLVENEYKKPLSSLSIRKDNAPLTTEVLQVLHNRNLSVSEALEIISDAIYLVNKITKF